MTPGPAGDAALPLRPRIARKARLRWDAHREKHMLIYPERGLVLNAIAARIVALSDGSRTVDEMVVTLCGEFEGTERARIEGDTVTFLESLRVKGLLERDGLWSIARIR